MKDIIEECRSQYRHYVEDQVLVVGPEDEIEAVLRAIQDEFDVDLEMATDGKTELWQLNWDPSKEELVGPCLEGILPELYECLKKRLEVHLYKIRRRQPGIYEPGLIEHVVQHINRGDVSPCVRADLNWLTGYPYSVAGSPYSVAGSPYSVAGSPYTKHGGPVGPDDFWNQWALEKIGLMSNGNRVVDGLGQNVQVGVFDTSPFAESGTPEPASDGHPPHLTVVHPWVFEHLRLPPPPPPQSIGAGPPPAPPDLSSHGLSVAGLVYAVAPGSDIYLYRVLDKHARGNLFVLCYALVQFLMDVLSDQKPRSGGIINLSLGLDLPHDWQDLAGSGSIFALDIVLALAHCLGLTVVAASGNRSAGRPAAVPAEFPASQPYAIGVMASNYDDDRSCFSNLGDLTAPGGDGYDCRAHRRPKSRYDTCQCPWDIATIDRWKYGLIGPVLPNREFPQGFARWIGTSFAAPLVSGMAALMREHHGGSPPMGVSGEILNHLRPGGSGIVAGIIDVQGY